MSGIGGTDYIIDGNGDGRMKKESLDVCFLYGTCLGRILLKALVKPGFSQLAEKYLDSPWSRWMVPVYIRKHGIYIGEYERENYRSFQDFFIRKRKAGFQSCDKEERHLISPCDGFLSAYPIGKDSAYRIKHVKYSVAELLQNKKLAERFQGGTCLIFRLTPGNYHRYCYVDEGKTVAQIGIPGVLHCVRPMAYERYPVFIQNSREYALLRTEHFGTMVQMEVGALLVGKINNYADIQSFHRGEEKGYFKFGGSTIILLLEKGRVRLGQRVLKNMQRGQETKVRMGSCIAVGR